MKIYRPGVRGKQCAFVQPGIEHKVSDFLNADGTPKMITITFIEGVAEVPSNLGKYMIDTQQARRSPLILPDKVAA